MQRSTFNKEFFQAYHDAFKRRIQIHPEDVWRELCVLEEEMPSLHLSFESIQHFICQAELEAVLAWLFGRPRIEPSPGYVSEDAMVPHHSSVAIMEVFFDSTLQPFLAVVMRLIKKFSYDQWSQLDRKDKYYLAKNLDMWVLRKRDKQKHTNFLSRLKTLPTERQNSIDAFLQSCRMFENELISSVYSFHYFATLLVENQQLPTCYSLPARPNAQAIRYARFQLPEMSGFVVAELRERLFFNHYSAKPTVEIKVASLETIFVEASGLHAKLERNFKTENEFCRLCKEQLPLKFVRDDSVKLTKKDFHKWTLSVAAQEERFYAVQTHERDSRIYCIILELAAHEFGFGNRISGALPLRCLE
jgi:hypothetical protein